MKLLLTGATGFLGSHLLRMLVTQGHTVVILKRSFSDCRRIEELLPEVSWLDLDKEPLEEVFKRFRGISTIIHTATSYGRKGEASSELFSTNAVFPLQLITTAIAAGVSSFINTDTSLPGMINAYALSKRQFGEWGRFLATRREIQFVNLELEHFYGAGDDRDKFTTHVIRSCIDNVPVLKLTPGEQCRDFIHIDDVVTAYRMILEAAPHLELQFQQYGVGSGLSTRIRSFVETVHRLAHSTTRLDFGAVPYRDDEVMDACADVTALTALGWSPRISLVEGLERTIVEEQAKGQIE